MPHSRVIKVIGPGAFESFTPNLSIIRSMVQKGITNLTGKLSLEAAWHSLISTQDVVGIKVYSEPGALGGTRPAVVEAIIQELLAAGMPPGHIVIWDKHLSDLRLAGFSALARRYGVQVAGSADAGYDPKAFYETALVGRLVWGDYEFGRKGKGIGRRSYVSKLLTQRLTKIINVAPLRSHTAAGVAGTLFSLAIGSVDNTLRFETNPDRLATAVPEIYALPALGNHVVLSIVDALVCQYQGEQLSLLHYSTILNQLWFSKDPVALDALSEKEVERQRTLAHFTEDKIDGSMLDYASQLQLGVSDPRQIQVIAIH